MVGCVRPPLQLSHKTLRLARAEREASLELRVREPGRRREERSPRHGHELRGGGRRRAALQGRLRATAVEIVRRPSGQLGLVGGHARLGTRRVQPAVDDVACVAHVHRLVKLRRVRRHRRARVRIPRASLLEERRAHGGVALLIPAQLGHRMLGTREQDRPVGHHELGRSAARGAADRVEALGWA